MAGIIPKFPSSSRPFIGRQFQHPLASIATEKQYHLVIPHSLNWDQSETVFYFLGCFIHEFNSIIHLLFIVIVVRVEAPYPILLLYISP